MLSEGFDYVVGEKDLPRHFKQPRFPVLWPERSIIFANGHVLQAVAVDRADSIAGQSVVHGFFEEMKHSKGEKLKTRIIPAIRTSRIGNGSEVHKCHLHGGITGVSDIGRVSLGEDNWFTEYEKEVNSQDIEDIITLALYIIFSGMLSVNLPRGTVGVLRNFALFLESIIQGVKGIFG